LNVVLWVYDARAAEDHPGAALFERVTGPTDHMIGGTAT
jgi:hypothetical protein